VKRRAVECLPEPGIVSGGDMRGTEAARPLERDTELDLAVAEHVGIGRAAGRVLTQEVPEHALAVFSGEARAVQGNAELRGHGTRILEIAPGGAVGIVVVLFPVAHEEPLDVPAGLLEEQRGDRGVDPSGEADDDASSGGRRCRTWHDHAGNCTAGSGRRQPRWAEGFVRCQSGTAVTTAASFAGTCAPSVAARCRSRSATQARSERRPAR